jgi:hypothetical protein
MAVKKTVVKPVAETTAEGPQAVPSNLEIRLGRKLTRHEKKAHEEIQTDAHKASPEHLLSRILEIAEVVSKFVK